MNFIGKLWRKVFHKDYIVYDGTMKGITISADMNGDKIVLGEMKDFEVARPRIYLTHDIEFKEISIVDNPPDPYARIIGVDAHSVHIDELRASVENMYQLFCEFGICMEQNVQQLEVFLDAVAGIKKGKPHSDKTEAWLERWHKR